MLCPIFTSKSFTYTLAAINNTTQLLTSLTIKNFARYSCRPLKYLWIELMFSTARSDVNVTDITTSYNTLAKRRLFKDIEKKVGIKKNIVYSTYYWMYCINWSVLKHYCLNTHVTHIMYVRIAQTLFQDIYNYGKCSGMFFFIWKLRNVARRCFLSADLRFWHLLYQHVCNKVK